LQKRCSEKRTEFIPSHLELKTLFLPSWHGISSIFGGVEKANEELKKIFKLKYNYASALIFSDTEPEIIVDTREQNPLPFENAKVMKLSCGDYSTAGELYSEVFVERKSLSDFVSTLSGGKDRFKRELDRAKDLDYYIVVVIEDSFHNANNWKPNKNFKQSVNSQYIFYVMRSILSSYDNVQFVFADSRNHAMNLIQKIFQLKENVRNVDLEFAKDFNLI
jgi:ERCC4-type nuclease